MNRPIPIVPYSREPTTAAAEKLAIPSPKNAVRAAGMLVISASKSALDWAMADPRRA